jgi:hypothetical protein
MRPVRPFLSPCFLDYIARLLSNPETEKLLDSASDAAAQAATDKDNPDFVLGVHDGDLLRVFQGRDGTLFVNRGTRMRLAFSLSFDNFPPFGSRKRSNNSSIGVLKATCLNLPEAVRDKPENIAVAIIPGQAPKGEHINPYLRPWIDVGVLGWTRGIHFSSTGASPDLGRIVDIAFVLSVSDLPAARQLAGAAHHNAHIFCTCCECRGRDNVYRTDFENWKRRDPAELRRQAEAWRDAETLAEREMLYQQNGVRWSELWRLPYWDPTRMLAVDTMHCVLEGLVQYHCRRVLRLNIDDAELSEKSPAAYEYDFPTFDPQTTPSKCSPKSEKEQEQIEKIHDLLVRPFRTVAEDDTSDDLTRASLFSKLMQNNKPALLFVCWSLGLGGSSSVSDLAEKVALLVRCKKKDLTEFLVTWVSRVLRVV